MVILLKKAFYHIEMEIKPMFFHDCEKLMVVAAYEHRYESSIDMKFGIRGCSID